MKEQYLRHRRYMEYEVYRHDDTHSLDFFRNKTAVLGRIVRIDCNVAIWKNNSIFDRFFRTEESTNNNQSEMNWTSWKKYIRKNPKGKKSFVNQKILMIRIAHFSSVSSSLFFMSKIYHMMQKVIKFYLWNEL